MKPSPEILNELLEISPLVAKIPRPNDLFSLPGGYFDQLAEDFLTQILAGQADRTPSFLNELDKNLNFPIPGNYFENLPEKILALVKAGAEHSAKAEIGALSPFLDQIDRKNPFSFPADYFDNLSGQLIAGLSIEQPASESQTSESVVLGSLSHENLYTTPEGYFESLPEIVLSRVNQEKKGAKVLFLSRNRSFLKYAAAAVIAGFPDYGGNKSCPDSDQRPGNFELSGSAKCSFE